MNSMVERAHILHIDEQQPRWFAIYVKYKTEKYVCDKLSKKEIEAYVPLLSSTKRYGRKVKEYHKPLLNCYVFVNITKEQYVRVLETEYVMKFIKQGQDLLAIPEEEIILMKRVVGEMDLVKVGERSLEPGTAVEVIAGSLTGIKGRIVDRKSKRIFTVALDYIGVQLEMEIDHGLLRPLAA